MPQYHPSFVDTTGMAQGVTQGLMQATAMRQKQDQIVQADLNDFQKNYDPKNLRKFEIPKFTDKFKEYKDAALRYSRLNQGGAKPEELAVASKLKDMALNDMNDLYRRSTMASEKQAEYSEYIKNAQSRGYLIPSDVSDNYMHLSSNDVDSFNVESVPSAWSHPLVSKDIDMAKLTNVIDIMGGRSKEKSIEHKTGRELAKTASGKSVYAENIITTSSRDPNSVVMALDTYAPAHPEVYNAMKDDYDNLVKGVNNNDPTSIAKLGIIKNQFGLNDTDGIDKVRPSMSFGAAFYMPTSTVAENTKGAEMEIAAENERSNRYYKGETIKSQKEKSNIKSALEDPFTSINNISSNLSKYKIASPKDYEFQPRTGDVDVTREFASYTIPNDLGMKSSLKHVLYNKGGKSIVDGTEIQPFITFTTDDDKNPQRMTDQQFAQKLVMSSPDITFKGTPQINRNPKAYSKDVEKLISMQMSNNPNYSREEIIAQMRTKGQIK